MSSQYLFLIGGLGILTLLMLSFNRFQNVNTTASINNESIISASALAQGLIDEISTRSFDENTVVKGVTSKDSLTLSNSLGSDLGEASISQFDDIDDFNNYTKTISLARLGTFNLAAKVQYIQNMQQNNVISSRSFSKRIQVNIYSAYLPDTLKLYNIISY